MHLKALLCFKQLYQEIVLMEAIGDYYVITDEILDAWHCTLGVDFAHATGEMGTTRHHAMFAIHVFLKHRKVQKILCAPPYDVDVPVLMKHEQWEACRFRAMC
jgi:hypothetical protein